MVDNSFFCGHLNPNRETNGRDWGGKEGEGPKKSLLFLSFIFFPSASRPAEVGVELPAEQVRLIIYLKYPNKINNGIVGISNAN